MYDTLSGCRVDVDSVVAENVVRPWVSSSIRLIKANRYGCSVALFWPLLDVVVLLAVPEDVADAVAKLAGESF